MTWSQLLRDDFDHIYSIELSEELWANATTRFASNPSVEIVHGDSGVELAGLVPSLATPALFWLDGHYSAGVTARGPRDTPVMDELEHIFSTNELAHVALIDDAREFGRDPAYPTVEDVRQVVGRLRPGYGVSVADDAIRVAPE